MYYFVVHVIISLIEGTKLCFSDNITADKGSEGKAAACETEIWAKSEGNKEKSQLRSW